MGPTGFIEGGQNHWILKSWCTVLLMDTSYPKDLSDLLHARSNIRRPGERIGDLNAAGVQNS